MTTKGLFIPVFPMLLLCGIVTSAASAQDGNSTRSSAVAALNAKHATTSEITIAGTIQEVSSEHSLGRFDGLHLLMNSPLGVFDANVGPYITEEVRQALSAGQQIQVVGVIQTINGHNYLLAHQLVLPGRQIPIRNENGFLVHTHARTGNHPQPSQSEPNGDMR
jgi:hypothetical protein